MTPEHLPLLVELDSDAEVLRYILGRARTPEEVHAFWGPKCADLSADALGLGWWVGFAGSEFVGWWDLSPSSVDRAEAGWRLGRRWWRQGLASEGAAALVRHGFEDARLSVIWAETMAVNAGSRGVMARLGMRHVRTDVRAWDDPLPGGELGEVVYEITAEEWEGQSEGRARRRPPR
ncbi:MAG: hypothetical protein JWO46_1957 [Nocardioidaceae bacterium]|nr:hypothetical protein [Nocardioidaceae bacterium]